VWVLLSRGLGRSSCRQPYSYRYFYPYRGWFLKTHKPIFWKRFITKMMTNQKPKSRKGEGESKINKEQRHTSPTEGRQMPSPPKKARPADKHAKTLPAPRHRHYYHLRSWFPTIKDLNPILSQPPILSHVLCQTGNSQVLSDYFL